MQHDRGDFSRYPRLLPISALAIAIGAISTAVAKALLMMIALFTQIFYYGHFSFEPAKPSAEHWGIYFIFVPVIGGLVIGLKRSILTEKIARRGYDIFREYAVDPLEMLAVARKP
jgi:chloride channel protein, CIC family